MAHQTTTTVWSQPATTEQKNYFSRMAGFRRTLTWVTVIFIGICIALDLSGAFALSAETIGRVTAVEWIVKGVPIALLTGLHIVAKKALETHFYYKWDADPQTNLHPVFFVLPYTVIIGIGIYGSITLFKGFVAPVAAQNSTTADTRLSSRKSSADNTYDNSKKSLEETYKSKINAANQAANAAVAAQQKRRQQTPADRAVIAREIRKIEVGRQEKLAAAEVYKADGLQKHEAARNDAYAQADEDHHYETTGIKQHNEKENTRFEAETADSKKFAYAINLVFLILTIMLIIQKVRIDTKSGIFPIRQYTELDAHGGWISQAQTVFSDIFNLRMTQMLSAIHKVGAPKEVKTYDGSVLFKREGHSTGSTTPEDQDF